MNRFILLVLLVCLTSLAACGGGDPVEIQRVSTEDITVRVLAIPVPMATHGEVIVTHRDNNQELARVRVIEATDYVEDVRFRIKDVHADGLRVRVCMKDPPSDLPSLLFTSAAGVAVTLTDAESNAHECQ